MTEAIITKYLLAKHISLTGFCDKGEIVKKSRNNRGPSVEPCGIPMFIDDGDREMAIHTHVFHQNAQDFSSPEGSDDDLLIDVCLTA